VDLAQTFTEYAKTPHPPDRRRRRIRMNARQNAPRHCTGRLCLLLRPSGRRYDPDVTPHVTPEGTPRRYTLTAPAERPADFLAAAGPCTTCNS
jgi:hypothetical protein